MKKKGKKLEFISFIKRDGSGTIAIGTKNLKDYPQTDCVNYLNEVKFKLTTLSLSEETYIASEFNSFVVKLKPKTK